MIISLTSNMIVGSMTGSAPYIIRHQEKRRNSSQTHTGDSDYHGLNNRSNIASSRSNMIRGLSPSRHL